MDLAKRKLQLMEQFMKIASVEKIEKLEKYFKKEISNDSDLWDEIPTTVQKIIDKSLEESEKGEVIPHNEVMAKVRAKYKIA